MAQWNDAHGTVHDENSLPCGTNQSHRKEYPDLKFFEDIELQDFSAKNNTRLLEVNHSNKELAELIAYLREPGPICTTKRARIGRKQWQSFNSFNEDILGGVNYEFIPESPSLQRTLVNANETPLVLPELPSAPHLRSLELDLSPVDKVYEPIFDCQPFYHLYEYENRREEEDYDAILEMALADEISGRKVCFDRELEYQERRQIIGIKEYLLFYLFGIDKFDFFQLKNERDRFHSRPFKAYASNMRYTECFEENNDGDSTESEETSYRIVDQV